MSGTYSAYPLQLDGMTVWACCVSNIGPVCAHVAGTIEGEKTRIYRDYPGRDGHGYVTGHYVYNRRGGYRVAGPFPSRAAALDARAESQRLELDALDVIVGHVFTSAGTIVRTASTVHYRAVHVERMPRWEDVAPARRAAYEIRHAVEIVAGVSAPGDRVTVSDGRGARSVRRSDLVDVTVSARVEAVPA